MIRNRVEGNTLRVLRHHITKLVQVSTTLGSAGQALTFPRVTEYAQGQGRLTYKADSVALVVV